MQKDAEVSTQGSRYKTFLTSDEFFNAHTAFILPIALPSLLGIITNLLNIRVFTRMGLKDCVSISYLVLSVSDFGIVILIFGGSIVTSVGSFEMKTNFTSLIHTEALGWIFGSILQAFIVLSTAITCYLAVTKSMCVVLPFRFKELFTPVQTIVTLCILAGICFVQLTIFTQIDIKWIRLTDNSTQAVLSFRESFKHAHVVYDIFAGPLMTIGSEIIASACIGIMVYKLNESVNFRLGSTQIPAAQYGNSNNALKRDVNAFSDKNITANTSICASIEATVSAGIEAPADAGIKNITLDGMRTRSTSSAAMKLPTDTGVKEAKKSTINNVTVHEKRVIRQVILVVLIFIILKLPNIGINMLRRVEEKFFISNSYRRMSILINFGKFTFEALNASINIFVYYRYNSKYRQTLRQILGLVKMRGQDEK